MGKGKSTPGDDRIERFCREYTVDRNATRSATVAGYSPKTAGQQASRLLKNVKVRARIEQLLAEIAARNDVTVDRVLKEYARLGFHDARRFFMDDGTPIPIQELDDDTAAALAGMEVLEEFEGTGKERKFIGYTKKFKLADKKGALDSMARFLGMFVKDNEQKNNPLKEMFELLNASRGRKGLI